VPTNKLWIEHTERAAWQSVQALREKLAEAEQRAERMAPPAQGWRELFAELDAARANHALAGTSYAELLASALERLARAEAERRSLELRLAGEPRRAAPEPEPPPRRRSAGAYGTTGESDFDEGGSRSERRFFRDVRERVRELGAERPRPNPEAELGDIETRLADLPSLDAGEIADIAADLAALALYLAGDRTPSAPSPDDD
jgi:hypothetical protein